MKKTMRGVFIIGLISVLFISACGSGSSGGSSSSTGAEGASNSGETKTTINLRVGSGHTTEGGVWTQLTHEFFVPEVNKRLEGTPYNINWTESYGGSVATLGENLDAVQDGLLDLSMLIVPFKPSDLLISNMGYNTPTIN